MTYDQENPILEPVNIVLGLAYVTAVFVLIGWIVTLLV
jgi:hypothetical protein